MTIRWITDRLGTSPWSKELVSGPHSVVDVRLLRDAAGNPPALIRNKIDEAFRHLEDGRRVIICCDYGVSRSNVIAAGVLARQENISLDESLRRVIRATGESGIKVDLVQDMRRALDISIPEADSPSVLVLGGDGFIGRNLSTLMGNTLGCDAIGQDMDLVWNPVLLDAAMQGSGANRLLFCWHPPGLDTNQAAGQLVSALRNALEVCRVRKAGIVFLSGQQVFSGHRRVGEVSFSEEDEPQPGGAAGDALFLGEVLVKQYAIRYDLPVLIVRPSYIYGEGDERPWLLNTLIRKALRGDDVVTHHYENGSPLIDLLHVSDLAKALSLAMEVGQTGVLHVSSDNRITTRELAKRIVRMAGSSSRLASVEMPGGYRAVRLVSKIRSRLPQWAPTVSLEAGLRRVVAALAQDLLKDET